MKDLSNRIAERLKLNEYKRIQLEADLQTADINMTPEAYVADNIVKSLFGRHLCRSGVFPVQAAGGAGSALCQNPVLHQLPQGEQTDPGETEKDRIRAAEAGGDR